MDIYIILRKKRLPVNFIQNIIENHRSDIRFIQQGNQNSVRLQVLGILVANGF